VGRGPTSTTRRSRRSARHSRARARSTCRRTSSSIATARSTSSSRSRGSRHCIGLNHTAIGIENVGDEAKFPLTDAQVEADAELVRYLVATRPAITRLYGHHEVMGLRGDPIYVELDAGYKNDKGDPGRRFMTKVRAKLTDLALRGP
jgi:hypothetical protein